MDIKQDPNAIPNFNSGGRIGELQPNQPEQRQSSVELDPTAGGDGAASDMAMPESVPEADASTRGKPDPAKTVVDPDDGAVAR